MRQEIKEFECPYCKEIFYMKRGGFSNHMRYCKCNPNVDINRKNNKLMGERMHLDYINKKENIKNEYTFICEHCGKEYKLKLTETEFNKKKYTKFCSRSCANVRYHSEETKQKIAKSLKQYYPKQKRYCIVCGKELQHNKKYCSNKCKRFNILLGKTLYLEKNEEQTFEIKKIYKRFCQFNFSLSSFKNEFDFELIKQFGWYKAKNHGNNLNGISRDHRYSCDEGFNNLVDPYIISHPANCELLQHSKNIAKYVKCSITLEQLIENIKEWNKKYGEYENKIDYDIFEKLGIEFKYKYNTPLPELA